jgi:hypothetical protein
MSVQRRISSLDDASIDNLMAIAAGLEKSEFLEILFNVAAEMADDGVPHHEIAAACERVFSRLGIDLKRAMN